jgi:hypothetical protein
MGVEHGKIKDSRKAYESVTKQVLLNRIHTEFVIFMKLVMLYRKIFKLNLCR